jgi:hypothetical protein
MADIAEEYKSSIESISIAKEKGISFDWNGIDLSDLLLAEWIENKIKGSNTNCKNLSFIHKIKLKLHAWKQRVKSINKNRKYEIVVFLNSQSQWAILKPVLIELVNGGSNLKVLTTKPVLLKQILQYHLDGSLLLGYHFKKWTHKEDHPLQSLIYQSMPKLSYLYESILPYLNHPHLTYLLIGNDNTSEGRLIAKMAIQKNILTGCIQHGSLNRINPLHGRSIVNHFFAFGVKPQQELIFLGKSSNEIFVKGWPLQAQFKKNINDIETTQDLVVKSAINKSKIKIYIIQQIDRKINLDEIVEAKDLTMTELIEEIEHICYSGTRLNLDYYINQIIDEDRQDDIYDYFMAAETDNIGAALKEFESQDASEEELRLMRIKFLSEMAN